MAVDPRELVRLALRVAADKHGENLRVLDVGKNLQVTDYFVLITAQNRRQAQAICAAIDYETKHAGVTKPRIEGYAGGWWILLDFDEIVIHVFQSDARAYYNMEQLWADADDCTESFLQDSAEASRTSADPERASE